MVAGAAGVGGTGHPHPETSLPTARARMRLAIRLAAENIARESGGPFGAAVFERDSGRVVSAGVNLVVPSCCSLAHAEAVALALAQRALGTHDLSAPGYPRWSWSSRPAVLPVLRDDLVVGRPGPDRRGPRRGRRIHRRLPRGTAPARLAREAPRSRRITARSRSHAMSSATRRWLPSGNFRDRAGRPTIPGLGAEDRHHRRVRPGGFRHISPLRWLDFAPIRT